MVKSLISIAGAFAILLSAAFLEWFYVEKQFQSFGQEIEMLTGTVEAETANEEDAKIVRNSWEDKKSHLHILIPHNDISRVDDWISETVSLIGEKNYSLALSKLEVLQQICRTVPETYRPGLENIF